MPDDTPWPTVWLALASSAFYALGLVTAQLGLRYQAPRAGATVSVPTTAVAMWLIAFAFARPGPLVWPAIAVFAAIGALFPIGVTLLSFEGNRRLGPTLAGALGNVTPLVAVGFATLVLGEQLTLPRAAGLLVVMAGVVLLTLRRKLEARSWPFWALLLPLAAALIRGTAQPAMKLGLAHWPRPFVATLVSYSVSSVIILGLAAVLSRRRAPVRILDRRGSPIFALTGLCNGASLLTLYTALGMGRVTLVAPLVATYPLFTLAFSAILLRSERIHPRLLVGVGLTVLGVAVVLVG